MKCLFWNMRGYRSRGRKSQLIEYLKKVKVDIIFLSETMRQSFTMQELECFDLGDKFTWIWGPAPGHLGGMLLGVRDSSLDVGCFGERDFLLYASILHRKTKFKFEFVGVYGPADHSFLGAFLQELEMKVTTSPYPVLVGGGF